MKKCVFILGATATGKSRLCLELAKLFSAPLINADSLQVYKSVNIGTAKPSQEELASHPHHLFDFVEEGVEFTAADYVQNIRQLKRDLKSSASFFCGGSGFYFQALEKGLYPQTTVDSKYKQQAKEFLEENGGEKTWEYIKDKDSDYAQKIHPSDSYRLIRSLEILFSQNKNISSLKKELAVKRESILAGAEILKIGILWERELLRERVTERVTKMLDSGFLLEVEGLLAKGLEDWAPLKSVGYREVVAYLNSPVTDAELHSAIVTSTMQLAKKQMTWFRRDKDIQWLEPGKICRAEGLVENFM